MQVKAMIMKKNIINEGTISQVRSFESKFQSFLDNMAHISSIVIIFEALDKA